MRTLLILMILLLGGCGWVNGSCPDTRDLPRVEVESGTYLGNELGYGQLEGADDAVLVVDREAEIATLTFTTPDGREVEIDYTVNTSSFDFD